MGKHRDAQRKREEKAARAARQAVARQDAAVDATPTEEARVAAVGETVQVLTRHVEPLQVVEAFFHTHQWVMWEGGVVVSLAPAASRDRELLVVRAKQDLDAFNCKTDPDAQVGATIHMVADDMRSSNAPFIVDFGANVYVVLCHPQRPATSAEEGTMGVPAVAAVQHAQQNPHTVCATSMD